MSGHSSKTFINSPHHGSASRITLPNLILIVSLMLLVFGAGRALAVASGTLDDSFDVDGIATTAFGASTADELRGITLQPDGKIVAVGYSDVASPSPDFATVRYNTDGTLDNAFGTGGKVLTDVGATDVATSVLVQSDGKIIVVGSSGRDIAIVRYNANGTLDNTYGVNAIVATDIGSNSYEFATSAALQSDGKLVVSGITDAGVVWDMALLRYNTDGTLDNTFGTGGIVLTDFGTTNDSVQEIAIQSDGKIVMAGSRDAGSGYDFALVRYDADGVLDNTFGTGGKLTTDFGFGADEIQDLVVQADGKIVVTGYVDAGPFNQFGFARYSSNGALDSSFGVGGTAVIPIGTYDGANALVLQSDGKIIAGGYSENSLALMRLTSDGVLDNTFGTNGKVVTDTTMGFDAIYRVALQTNGKIVIGATFNSDFAIARYHPESDPVATTTTTTTTTTSTSTSTTTTTIDSTTTTEGTSTSTSSPTESTSGTLPPTGQSSNSNVLSALVLLAIGLFSIVASRRKYLS